MQELIGKVLPVLDHGHVVLMDYMGSDSDIVAAARTCYQKGTSAVSDDRALIRYLMNHKHTSPYESAVIKLHIKLPIFVERQWARHRTAGWNEVSARYSELPEEFYVPAKDDVQPQSTTNKQGREGSMEFGVVEDFVADCKTLPVGAFEAYHRNLQNNVSRELARITLPLSTYTEKVWWINLHNLLHFLGLRMDAHAQKEIRDYAKTIGEQIVKPLFPMVWEAFVDYRLNGITLSGPEIEAFKMMTGPKEQWKTMDHILTKREQADFEKKLQRLGICHQSS
jgi:thymidylate synthase (FAD)